jgi:hypothetical protein
MQSLAKQKVSTGDGMNKMKELKIFCANTGPFNERVMGIEPTLSAWKAEVLPLNYTRLLVRSGYK